MQPAITAEQSLQTSTKVRKSKRNITPVEYAGRQSVKEPKIAKQLIKNSEKHDIERLIEDLLEDEEHGIADPQEDKKSSKNSQPKQTTSEEQKEITPDFQAPYEFEKRFSAEFEEYNELYKDMIAEETVIAEPLDMEFYAEEGVIKLLAKLYYLCGENYYETNALQLWNDLKKCFSKEELDLMEQDPQDFYKKHLFFFDRFSKTDKSKGSLIETLQLVVEYLSDPYIRRPSDSALRNLDSNSINEIMNQQCTLLKGFVRSLGINPRILSLAAVAQRYPFKEVDVVQRNPDIPVFLQNNVKKIVNHNQPEPEKMKLEEYYPYIIDSNIRVPQYVKDQDKKIKVALDIGLEDCKDQMDELKAKIPQPLLFNSKYDVLRITNKKVPGVSLPKIDLQVEGAWVGGQEENLCLRNVNINHGPNSCYWYIIDNGYGAEFRQAKKDLYTADVHKGGDLWSCDIDFCLRNRIKIEYFAQEPGDIVITGPGCSVWTRADGVTMTTAWRIFRKDKVEFEKAFERYELNNENDIKTKIPIKSVTLSLVLQEFASTPVDLRIYLAEQLAKLYDKELEIYSQFKSIYLDAVFTYEPRKNIGFNCTVCKEELLNFYAYCDFNGKGKKPKNAGVLVCLNCYGKDYDNYTVGPGTPVLPYYKMSPNLVEEFQRLLRNIEANAPIILSQHKSFAAYIDALVEHDRKQELPAAANKEPSNNIKEPPVYQEPYQEVPPLMDEPIQQQQQQALYFEGGQLEQFHQVPVSIDIVSIPPFRGHNGEFHAAADPDFVDFPNFPNLLPDNFELPALQQKMEVENHSEPKPVEKKIEETKFRVEKVEKREKTDKTVQKTQQMPSTTKPVKKEKTEKIEKTEKPEEKKPKPQKSASDKSEKTEKVEKKITPENKPKEHTGAPVQKFRIEKTVVKKPEKVPEKSSLTVERKEPGLLLQKEKTSPTVEKKSLAVEKKDLIPPLHSHHKDKHNSGSEKKELIPPLQIHKEKPNSAAPNKKPKSSVFEETGLTDRFLASIPAFAPSNPKTAEMNFLGKSMYGSMFQMGSGDRDSSFKKKTEDEEPRMLSLFDKLKAATEPAIKEKEQQFVEEMNKRRLPEEETAAIEAAYTIKKRVKPDSVNKDQSPGKEDNDVGKNQNNNGDGQPKFPGFNF